jgi:hypothetical protein
MAAVEVQSTGNQLGSTSSGALTYPSSTTTGNALIALVSTYAGNAAGLHANAITDNKGNTWTRGAAIGKIDENACAVYYCLNATGGASHTVTFDPSDHGAQYVSMEILEFSGLATTGGTDDDATATATGTAWTVNLVTTVANCLLIGLASHDANPTPDGTYGGGSGYTVTHNYGTGSANPPILAQWKEVGAAGTYAFDGTISPSLPWMIAAIAIPLAGGTGPVTVSPAAATAQSEVVAPTVVLGPVTVVPSPAAAVAARANPTVLNSTTLAPAAATAQAEVTAPAVVLGAVTVVPAAATAQAEVVAPTVTGGSGILARDTFTAANNTLVTDRQSDSGHDWVMQTGSFDDTPFIITSNRARSQVATTNIGLLDYTPPTDYEVLAKLYRHTSSGWSIWGRASATTGSGYALWWNGSRFDLYRYVGGSGTVIGNSEEHASGYSLSDGTLYWVKVRYEIVAGDVEITAWIRADGDGEDTYTLMLDVTDSNAARHAAAGLAGLNLRDTTASTGHHTDEIRVQEVGATDALGPPVTVSPAAATAQSEVTNPTVVLGAATVVPAAASAQSEIVAPTVVLGAATIVPAAATAQAEVGQPNVTITGAVTYTPDPASARTDVRPRAGGDAPFLGSAILGRILGVLRAMLGDRE